MSVFWRTIRHLLEYKAIMLLGLICSGIVAICTVFPAWVIRSVVNDVLINKNIALLHWISGALIVVMLVKGIALFLQTYIMQYVSNSILWRVRTQCFDRLIHLSLGFYERQKTGQLMSRILSDVGGLQIMLTNITTLIGDTIALFGFVGYIFYLHWKLALISILIVPFIGGIINKFARRMKKIGSRMQNKIGDIAVVLQEFITGIKVIKSFTLEDFVRDRFEAANAASFKETMRGTKINAATTPTIEFINTFGLAIIFWYGGYEVIQGNLNAGELVSFLTALVGLFTPIKDLSRMSNTISQSIGAGERVYEIIDAPIELAEAPDALKVEKCEGHVEFENLSFCYENGEEILHSLNVDVKPGEIIALVGPSGAGKTTLVNLIPRFFDATSGAVKIDGTDVKKLDSKSMRRFIAVVPQETLLFSGTIEENIRMGRLDATRAEIEEAAKLANAHDFILAQPNGYETVLGERGVNLSGGQAQRVALSRAFLKEPGILILDEATSALDSETENLIKESLNRLMKNRTTFMIAHRLSTVINADRILVMQKGRISESGSHTELLARNGLYASLYHSQFKDQVVMP